MQPEQARITLTHKRGTNRAFTAENSRNRSSQADPRHNPDGTCQRAFALAVIAGFAVMFCARSAWTIYGVHKSADVAEMQPSPWLVAPTDIRFGERYTSQNVFHTLPGKSCKDLAKEAKDHLAKQIEAEPEIVLEHKQKLLGMKEPPLPFDRGTRGIVITCKLDSVCLANLLLLVRSHRTSVPIELWQQRGQLQPNSQVLLHRLFGDRVQVRYFEDNYDAYVAATSPLDNETGLILTHFKPMAMAMSRFDKVLLLDGDCYLLRPPEELLDAFANATATEHTAGMFWRDMYSICPTNPVWDMLGLDPVVGPAQESGIVLVDKSEAWRALYLAGYMNQRKGLYYRLLHGDKDTYFLSYKLLGLNYTVVPYTPYFSGRKKRTKFRGTGFLQPDMDGRPLALHLVSGKTVLKRTTLREKATMYEYVAAYNPNTCSFYNLLFPFDTNGVTMHDGREYLGNLPDVFAAYYDAAELSLP